MEMGQVTLNGFQERLEQRINATLKKLGLQVDSRRVGWEDAATRTGPSEAVVHLRAQELEVRIREDSVSFTLSGKGDYYEMPDYPNADALADAFLAVVTERWHRQSRM